jgi:hypothetical protein
MEEHKELPPWRRHGPRWGEGEKERGKRLTSLSGILEESFERDSLGREKGDKGGEIE